MSALVLVGGGGKKSFEKRAVVDYHIQCLVFCEITRNWRPGFSICLLFSSAWSSSVWLLSLQLPHVCKHIYRICVCTFKKFPRTTLSWSLTVSDPGGSEGQTVSSLSPSLPLPLSLHVTVCPVTFKDQSHNCRVQWFNMKPGKPLIQNSSRHSVVPQGGSSLLPGGWPRWPWRILGGTAARWTSCRKNISLLVIMSHLYVSCLISARAPLGTTSTTTIGPGSVHKNSSHVKYPRSSSFCLSSFMTNLEIITPAPCTLPCIDPAQGIETHQKTRQRGNAHLLCGNPPCGRVASFGFSSAEMEPSPNSKWCFFPPFLFLKFFFNPFNILYIYCFISILCFLSINI